MDLLQKTRDICKLYGIKPTRTKGQNFLIHEEVYDKIVEAGEVIKKDNILEVGPGLGFLTAKLGKTAKKVITVELDDKIAETLQSALLTKEDSNIEVINENVLDFDVNRVDYKDREYKIIANLPYNITSVFLRKFLTRLEKPSLIVLMLQKEVVDRITAKPGSMSLLALSVQFYAEAEKVIEVPAKDFWPAPEVDSAVIKIRLKKKFPEIDEKDFFRIAKIGFSAKRKMLKKNLANGLHLSIEETAEMIQKIGLKETVRAQELSVDNWIELSKLIKF